MNKNDLNFLKKFLEKRKSFIIENLHSNSAEIEALHNSAPSDSIDFSVIETNSQIDLAISANLKEELNEILDALGKIKNNIYGTCELCEDDIGIERLKIKPHAKYCITCREIIEKGKNNEN